VKFKKSVVYLNLKKNLQLQNEIRKIELNFGHSAIWRHIENFCHVSFHQVKIEWQRMKDKNEWQKWSLLGIWEKYCMIYLTKIKSVFCLVI